MREFLRTHLVGICVARLYDTDLMIGKFHVPSGKRDFRHVATHTIRFRDWTGFCSRGSWRGRSAHGRRLSARAVAGQTFCIVSRIFADNVLMGIVASHATDARVGTVEAFAVRQAVRLKADIDLTVKVTPYDSFPGAMTLTTEVRYILR